MAFLKDPRNANTNAQQALFNVVAESLKCVEKISSKK
jgi:hypothetical protein